MGNGPEFRVHSPEPVINCELRMMEGRYVLKADG